jgi:hypothetical protein
MRGFRVPAFSAKDVALVAGKRGGLTREVGVHVDLEVTRQDGPPQSEEGEASRKDVHSRTARPGNQEGVTGCLLQQAIKIN